MHYELSQWTPDLSVADSHTHAERVLVLSCTELCAEHSHGVDGIRIQTAICMLYRQPKLPSGTRADSDRSEVPPIVCLVALNLSRRGLAKLPVSARVRREFPSARCDL